MHEGQQALLIFEEQLDDIRETLKKHVIRMATSLQHPQNPLRPNKEITYDATGNFVLPNSATGISLAASIKHLRRIWRPGRENWLLSVDRQCPMPEGLRLQPDSDDHWSVVVTRRMSTGEFNARIEELIARWKVLGRYVRYE